MSVFLGSFVACSMAWGVRCDRRQARERRWRNVYAILVMKILYSFYERSKIVHSWRIKCNGIENIFLWISNLIQDIFYVFQLLSWIFILSFLRVVITIFLCVYQYIFLVNNQLSTRFISIWVEVINVFVYRQNKSSLNFLYMPSFSVNILL